MVKKILSRLFGTKIFLFLVPLFLTGFFIFGTQSRAQSVNIIITEIGAAEGSGYEWIEIYNRSSDTVNLEGWKFRENDTNHSLREFSGGFDLSPRSYAIITQVAEKFQEKYSNANCLILDSSWSSLKESGEEIAMIDSDGNIVENFTYPSVSDYSLERINLELDDYTESNWQEHASANTVCAPNSNHDQNNSEEDSDQAQDDPEGENNEQEEDLVNNNENQDFNFLENQQENNFNSYKLGDVLINEFVSDPSDGEEEWIELYNALSSNINLEGWTIEEGSGAKTNLSGEITKYFIIKKPKGNLNNKGDIIILRDGLGTLVDQVAYGDWDDGDVSNNAPVASDPNSVARKINGKSTFNNNQDFAISSKLTPGASNVIEFIQEEEEEEISAEEKAEYDYKTHIIISEILPNPVGSDTEGEFIELYNFGESDINLFAWRLGDNTKKKYQFSDQERDIIRAGEYLVIWREQSNISLNNGSDSVSLWQPLLDNHLCFVEYQEAIEGNSFAYIASTSFSKTSLSNQENWVWSETPSPGEVNKYIAKNNPPEVDFYCPANIQIGTPIIFDSSDTLDFEKDSLKYSWDFNDGIKLNFPSPEHTYIKPGNFTVSLIVDDGEHLVKKEKIIRVIDPGIASSASDLWIATNTDENLIWISEIMPNPVGSDLDGEWIELYNQVDYNLSLLNWSLDDEEGGSRPYIWKENTIIAAHDFLLISRRESGISLNNNTDTVRLMNNVGVIVCEVEYIDAREGTSYARGANQNFFWTSKPTPKSENVISVSENLSDQEIFLEKNKNLKKIKANEQFVDLVNIKSIAEKSLVRTRGLVTVEPDVLASQFFYISSSSSAAQVYNYKKDFPDLCVGDYIEVLGEFSISKQEARIKIKTRDDIIILDQNIIPSSTRLKCDEIREEYLSQLISVVGDVVERSGSTIYLDDGYDEVEIYIKKNTGISAQEIREGSAIEVAGILQTSKLGLRILPRHKDDIVYRDIESHLERDPLYELQTQGKIPEELSWELSARDKKLELFRYLLVISVTIIIALLILLFKLRREMN